jgi:hypothetical protein
MYYKYLDGMFFNGYIVGVGPVGPYGKLYNYMRGTKMAPKILQRYLIIVLAKLYRKPMNILCTLCHANKKLAVHLVKYVNIRLDFSKMMYKIPAILRWDERKKVIDTMMEVYSYHIIRYIRDIAASGDDNIIETSNNPMIQTILGTRMTDALLFSGIPDVYLKVRVTTKMAEYLLERVSYREKFVNIWKRKKYKKWLKNESMVINNWKWKSKQNVK